jgi:hypothetical protein
MSDPTGWVAPKVNWLDSDGIANTDLNKIETNILGLRDWLKQGGAFDVNTVNLPGGEKVGTIGWEKHAQGIIVLKLPELLGTTNIGADAVLQLDPVVAWPAEIRVAASGTYQSCHILFGGDAAPAGWRHRVSHGAFELPYDAGSAINIYYVDKINGTLTPNFGIYKQFITYYNT